MSNLTATNGSGAQPWLKDSVRSFFESMAWDGKRPQVLATPGLSSPAGESLMTMAVSTFFETVPWDGQPVIAAPVAPIEMLLGEDTPTSDSMTLDAFSDLF